MSQKAELSQKEKEAIEAMKNWVVQDGSAKQIAKSLKALNDELHMWDFPSFERLYKKQFIQRFLEWLLAADVPLGCDPMCHPVEYGEFRAKCTFQADLWMRQVGKNKSNLKDNGFSDEEIEAFVADHDILFNLHRKAKRLVTAIIKVLFPAEAASATSTSSKSAAAVQTFKSIDAITSFDPAEISLSGNYIVPGKTMKRVIELLQRTPTGLDDEADEGEEDTDYDAEAEQYFIDEPVRNNTSPARGNNTSRKRAAQMQQAIRTSDGDDLDDGVIMTHASAKRKRSSSKERKRKARTEKSAKHRTMFDEFGEPTISDSDNGSGSSAASKGSTFDDSLFPQGFDEEAMEVLTDSDFIPTDLQPAPLTHMQKHRARYIAQGRSVIGKEPRKRVHEEIARKFPRSDGEKSSSEGEGVEENDAESTEVEKTADEDDSDVE